MHTIEEVNDNFASGAEAVTLTPEEWASIQEISREYSANHLQVSRAKAEADRAAVLEGLQDCRATDALVRMFGFTITRHGLGDAPSACNDRRMARPAARATAICAYVPMTEADSARFPALHASSMQPAIPVPNHSRN